MRAMNTNFQSGDQLLVDPNCHCLDPLSWDYYQTLYCPHCGIEPTTDLLTFVDLSPTAQRVWYLERQGSEDKALVQSVAAGVSIANSGGHGISSPRCMKHRRSMPFGKSILVTRSFFVGCKSAIANSLSRVITFA